MSHGAAAKRPGDAFLEAQPQPNLAGARTPRPR